MGCNIHIRFEVKNCKGIWTDADIYKRNPFYGIEDEAEFTVIEIYKGRSYSLFSVLANVRNDDDNDYICEPKGVPEDCNEHIKRDIEHWGEDGHSHSYFTLKELIDWQKKHNVIKYRGYMSPEDAKNVDKGKMPSMWWQNGNHRWQVYREWEVKKNILNPIIECMQERYIDVMNCGCYSKETLMEHAEDMRIVFWFDN